MTSYYDILGINEKATASEIHSAYKKKALKTHPDKEGGSAEKFDKLKMAHLTLMNEESRRKYDRKFKQKHNTYSATWHSNDNVQEKKFKVTLENIYSSETLTLKINKPVICEKCGGIGGEKIKCDSILHKNKNFTDFNHNSRHHYDGHYFDKYDGHNDYYDEIICTKCDHKGWYVDTDMLCESCDGKGYSHKEFPTQINLDPDDNFSQPQIIVDENEYEKNLYKIFLTEEKNPIFTRKGYDLYTNLSIVLVDALGLLNYQFTHLDNVKYYLQCDEIIKPGQVLCAPGLGIPRKRIGKSGNLYITFSIQFPPTLDQIKSGLTQLVDNKDFGKVVGENVVKLIYKEPMVP